MIAFQQTENLLQIAGSSLKCGECGYFESCELQRIYKHLFYGVIINQIERLPEWIHSISNVIVRTIACNFSLGVVAFDNACRSSATTDPGLRNPNPDRVTNVPTQCERINNAQ
jgi:hypothetical protein